MTLRKNQKRIKVPSEAKINTVLWDTKELASVAKEQFEILLEKCHGCSVETAYDPEVYCRINDDFIQIFPPAPYASVLTVAYTINEML